MLSFLTRNKVKVVEVNDLDNLLGNVNLIDVREPSEYKGGHLKTAINIPMDKILNEADKYLDKSKEYYVICRSGGRSSRTSEALKRMGYNVINVSGGTAGYKGNLER